jgi:hypothetical protein
MTSEKLTFGQTWRQWLLFLMILVPSGVLLTEHLTMAWSSAAAILLGGTLRSVVAALTSKDGTMKKTILPAGARVKTMAEINAMQGLPPAPEVRHELARTAVDRYVDGGSAQVLLFEYVNQQEEQAAKLARAEAVVEAAIALRLEDFVVNDNFAEKYEALSAALTENGFIDATGRRLP